MTNARQVATDPPASEAPGAAHVSVVRRARHRAHTHIGLVQLVACGSAALVMADSSAAVAVLAGLQRDGIAEFVNQPALTSVSTINLAALVALLAGGDRMVSALGERRLLWAGLALFGLGGVVAALAPAWSVLLAGRLIQGAAAALLLPAGYMLVMHDLPRSRQSRALVWWACWCGLGSVLGLTGAGPLVSSHGWRAVYVLAAIGSVALLAVLTTLSREQRPRAGLSDIASCLMPAASLLALVVLATEGRRWGWTSPPAVLCGVAALALAGAGLAMRARAARGPGASGERWRPQWGDLSPCLHGGIWLIILGWGAPVGLPTALDDIHRAWLIPLWLGLAAATPWSAVWDRRHGPMAVLCGSGLASIAGCFLLVVAQQPLSAWGTLAAAMIGGSLGALLTTTSMAGLSLAPPSRQASAAAALASARLLAGMISVNSASALLSLPLLDARLSGQASVVLGSLGLVALLVTAALIQARAAVLAAARSPAPVHSVMIVPPITAEAEVTALRGLLLELRRDIASMHADLSVALAGRQAAAQEPVELNQPPLPHRTSHTSDQP
ncbi:MFS transporter [Nonomuraea jabiensis]|uniref:MFS transporter n=1 Tax=Nonomuraea jabiensis TaxID=882448 RepID=UPI003D7341D7